MCFSLWGKRRRQLYCSINSCISGKFYFQFSKSTQYSLLNILLCIPTNSVRKFSFLPLWPFMVARLLSASHLAGVRPPLIVFELHFSVLGDIGIFSSVLFYASCMSLFFGLNVCLVLWLIFLIDSSTSNPFWAYTEKPGERDTFMLSQPLSFVVGTWKKATVFTSPRQMDKKAWYIPMYNESANVKRPFESRFPMGGIKTGTHVYLK